MTTTDDTKALLALCEAAIVRLEGAQYNGVATRAHADSAMLARALKSRISAELRMTDDLPALLAKVNRGRPVIQRDDGALWILQEVAIDALHHLAAGSVGKVTREEWARHMYESAHAGMPNVWSWDDSGLDDEHPGARDQYYAQADAIMAPLERQST